MKRKTEMENSRRRFMGILSCPSLALHHTHTTPALEIAYLRRIGLDKKEADAFVSLMCERGCFDDGAGALLETGTETPAALARRMLAEREEE